MKRNIKLAVPALALLALASCAAVEGQESGGQYVDDAAITTKIKADFVKDPAVAATQVHVETMQGVVELSGFVDNAAAENRAVEIARHVKGVRQVRDDIVVHPTHHHHWRGSQHQDQDQQMQQQNEGDQQ